MHTNFEKRKVFVSLVNVTRGSFMDVTAVPDTLLKLVAIKSLKMNNCKIMSTTTTKKVKQLFGGIFLGSNFPGVNFPGGNFPGQFSGRQFSRGIFSRGHLSKQLFAVIPKCQKKFTLNNQILTNIFEIKFCVEG